LPCGQLARSFCRQALQQHPMTRPLLPPAVAGQQLCAPVLQPGRHRCPLHSRWWLGPGPCCRQQAGALQHPGQEGIHY
jgi:hypothetical protein